MNYSEPDHDILIRLDNKVGDLSDKIESLCNRMAQQEEIHIRQWRTLDSHTESIKWLTRGFWTAFSGTGIRGVVMWLIRGS